MSIFYEGQAVGCLMYGEGKVIEIKQGTYPIKCEMNRLWRSYSNDGKYLDYCKATLYPIEQYRAIIANIPAPEPEKWQPKVGEWCLFGSHVWLKSMVLAPFVRKDNGKYIAKVKNEQVYYDVCAPFTGELPEHLKEVQP